MYAKNTRTTRRALKISATIVVLGGGLLVATGCKTDGIFADRHKVPKTLLVDRPSDPPHVKAMRAPLDSHLAGAQEADYVEEVLTNRARYHRSLEQLRAYYESRGYATKEQWARYELDGLKNVKAFRYMADAEVPTQALRASESISEADALYDKGLELMRRGGHGVPILYRENLMVQASKVFQELVERFPSSDKIDDAAFMLGEIHKEYLPDQEPIAVKWYERAWTWNPDSPHPARFQAAVVYDYRLHNRDRALELYQEVVQKETAVQSNVRFAMRRIGELTEGNKTEAATTRVSRATEP